MDAILKPGQLEFITTRTYRRLKLFDGGRFRCTFVEVLREVRQETGLRPIRPSRTLDELKN